MSTAKARITEFPSSPKIQETISEMQALVETMGRSIKFLRQRKEELEAEVSLVEADRDTALEILLWPFLVKHETTEEVLAFLDEHGLNPREPEHAEEIATFLERRAELKSALMQESIEG